MAGSLSVESYDSAELAGRCQASNRVIQAFQPDVFHLVSYPTRVSVEQELWRYVDVMHETRWQQTLDLLGGLTPTEFDLFRRATSLLVDFSTRHFGRPIHCENALLRALHAYRHIKAFNPSTVLEIGPGSGHLGLLLTLDGIGYLGIENTQAFYLIQNRVWSAAAGSRLVELASDDRSLREILASPLNGMAVHVPWWKVVDLQLAELPPAIDIVTANHCLCELHPNALKYYLRLARRLLSDSTCGAFLFEGWGSVSLRPESSVAREFDKANFGLCHNDPFITVYEGKDRHAGSHCLFPRSVAAPRRLRNLFRYLTALERLDYEYTPPVYASQHNPFSAHILGLRAGLKTVASVSNDTVSAFLRATYAAAPESPEEAFLRLVGTTF